MKAPKKQPVVKENIFHKFEFTAEELQELGRECAQITQDVNDLKGQAKSVASDYKAKVDQKESARNVVANKINNGFEMREIECVVEFDPEVSRKRYHDANTHELLKTADMTSADFQMRMFSDEQA
jgi:hypothetical protein